VVNTATAPRAAAVSLWQTAVKAGSSAAGGATRAAASGLRSLPAPLRKAAEEATRAVTNLVHDSTVDAELEDDLKDFDMSKPNMERFTVRSRLNAAGRKWVRRLRIPDSEVKNVCPRLVVSLSTIPPRVARLAEILRGIKRSSYSPDAIYLGIPPFSFRLGQRYVLPDWITNDPTITVVDLPVDYGPISKIAAAVIGEKDPDACIVT
jgi:hypothetical protein